MPKEYVHFQIALQSAHLPQNGRLGADARNHVPYLLLGAVFHDVLFYLERPWAGEPKPILRLPHRLHGGGGHDPYDLLRIQAAHAAKSRAPQARALLAGMASHIGADTAMHPLIHYLCGNYYAEPLAVERHRFLESCLDLSMAGSRTELGRYALAGLLRQTDPLTHCATKGLADLIRCREADVCNALQRAWTIFRRMNSFSLSRAGSLAAQLRPRLPRKLQVLRDILALAIPPRSMVLQETATLSGPLRYAHPVTGTPETVTFRALQAQARQNTLHLWHRLEPLAFGEAAPDSLAGPGPGLDSGLPGLDMQHAVHFAQPRFPAV